MNRSLAIVAACLLIFELASGQQKNPLQDRSFVGLSSTLKMDCTP